MAAPHPPDPPRWGLVVACGAAVAALSVVMFPLFPSEGAGYPKGLGSPVFAFEMARSAADLTLIFGDPSDPARAARIAAMDRGNLADYAFLVAYGAFIFTFFTAVRRATGRAGWAAFAALGIVAAASDAVENLILLGLTSDLAGAPLIGWLPLPVWAKFFSLMAAGLGLSVFLVTRKDNLWALLGMLALVGSLVVPLAFVSPLDYATYVGRGITVVWLTQLAYAARAWRAKTS